MRMFAAKQSDASAPFTQVHPMAFQVELCGYKPTEVEVKELSQSSDGCYFGWKSADGEIDLIQPSMLQLEMCSPDGFKHAIASGQGNFVPLSITEAAE